MGVAKLYHHDVYYYHATPPNYYYCVFLYIQVISLTDNPPDTRDDLINILTYSQTLIEFNISPTIGDLYTTLSLLDSIIILETIQPLTSDVLLSVTYLLNILLSTNNTELWLTGNTSSGANGLLLTVEQIGQLIASSIMDEEIDINREYVNIKVVNERPLTEVVYEIDSINSVRVPKDVITDTGQYTRRYIVGVVNGRSHWCTVVTIVSDSIILSDLTLLY